MLLDLWNQLLIITDLVDHLKELVEHGSFSFSIFFFLTVVGFVLYFAWQSTDIPDLPPPPHPPYVIQIQANVNTFNGGIAPGSGGRHTLSDVRLLSSGPLVDSVLNRIPSRQHHQTQHHQHTHGRRSALFFGLLRHPSPRPLLHFRPATRSRFQASNVIVYSQVNVYHSHGRQADDSSVSLSSSETATNVQRGTGSESNPVSEVSNTQGRNESISSSSSVPSSVGISNNAIHLGISNEANGSAAHARSRSQSEGTDITDLDVEGDGNTIDVDVEVDVNDVNVAENRQVGVDVDLNGDVTIVEHNTSGSSNSASSRFECDDRNGSSNNNPSVTAMNRTDEVVHGEGGKLAGSGGSLSGAVPPATVSPGQGPPNPIETDGDVRITLKFLNETQMEVTTQLSEKIADFKRRHFATELSENKVIRLIFNGRVLDNDGKTLQESGIFDQCVVHCLIVTPQNTQQRSGHGGHSQPGHAGGEQNARTGRSLREGPEPGMFFVSVLGIVLIFLWFICFHFGNQLFTQSAVISLVVLTAVFVIGLVALYLPVQSNNN